MSTGTSRTSDVALVTGAAGFIGAHTVRAILNQKRVRVLAAPSVARGSACDMVSISWLLKELGSRNIASLLVEGGGEVNASFLLQGFAHRVAFFFAPKILGGRGARHAVAGDGVAILDGAPRLHDVEWRSLGPDLLLTAKVSSRRTK